MTNLYRTCVFCLLAACVSMLVPQPSSAQSLWLSPDHEATVSIEAVKPFFKDGDATFFSSAANLNVRFPVSQVVLITAEVPVSYFDEKDFDVDNSFSLGNPYLGIEARPEGGLFFGELGVRFPVVGSDDNGVISGIFGDYERLDAYMVDRWCLAGFANVLHRPEGVSGLMLRARFGPMVSIYSGDHDFVDNTETFLAYGGQIWYTYDRISGAVGLFARTWVSESDVDNRTIEHMGLTLAADLGPVRPGVQVRVPLDQDFRESSGIAVGFHLTIPVGKQ